MNKLPIYFGCALLAGTEEYRQRITVFKKRLSDIPWILLYEFCTPLPGEAQSRLLPHKIYENDIIDGVGQSLVVLGDLTYPSTGLGGELAIAMREHKVRTMMFACRFTKMLDGEKVPTSVSKLWLGAPFHNPNASFEWYEESLDELFEKIISELSLIFKRTR